MKEWRVGVCCGSGVRGLLMLHAPIVVIMPAYNDC